MKRKRTKETLKGARRSWLRKRNRVMVFVDTPIGEVKIPLAFGRKAAAQACAQNLLECFNVSGISLILNGKFAGGRDGLGS